jgi:hypothetical protein
VAQTFSGIVALLPELDPVVGQYRSQFDARFLGLAAHVTLLSPWIAPAELREADLDELAQLFKSHQPFEVSFAKIESFPPNSAEGIPAKDGSGCNVYYLSPAPADPFLALTEDLCTVWPEYQPYGGAFEQIVPHLTVATTAGPAEAAELQQRLAGQLPLAATVAELAVVEIRDDQYSLRRRFRLGDKKR